MNNKNKDQQENIEKAKVLIDITPDHQNIEIIGDPNHIGRLLIHQFINHPFLYDLIIETVGFYEDNKKMLHEHFAMGKLSKNEL